MNDIIKYNISLGQDYIACGMGALLRHTVSLLKYAEIMGYIPSVLWTKDVMYYDKSINKDNIFEYFFLPIENHSHDKVIHSKKDDAIFFSGRASYDLLEKDLQQLALTWKKHMIPNDSLKKKINNDSKRFDGQKILAVHVRGTDFRNNYDTHPQYITEDQLLNKTAEVFDKGNYDGVFLATDEESAVVLFEHEFGSKLTINDPIMRSKDGFPIHYMKYKKGECGYFLLGEEVLRDIYSLSHCSGIVSTLSNVSMVSRIIHYSRNESYDDICILSRGRNHNNNVFINCIREKRKL